MLPTLTFLREHTRINVTAQKIEIEYHNVEFRLVHPINQRRYNTRVPLRWKHTPLPNGADGHVWIENLIMQVKNADRTIGWMDAKQINFHMVFNAPDEKADFILMLRGHGYTASN
ncbi:unnamed protein product, partial [Mesorhabditis belari]|uniref:Uncharacterized protein n=1 Tax=Mesorhabditis belari TaxID=2138241 RepID=A0AAF3EVL5_9BILA